MAIYPGEPGLAGFIGAKDDGCAGDNWSYKTCKAPQSNRQHQQTNTQLFTGRMPLMTPNQQCQSTEGNRLFSNTGLKCVSVFDDVV